MTEKYMCRTIWKESVCSSCFQSGFLKKRLLRKARYGNNAGEKAQCEEKVQCQRESQVLKRKCSVIKKIRN